MAVARRQSESHALWLYASAIALVLIAGGVATYYTYSRTDTFVRSTLLNNASIVAYALNTDRIKELSGSEADLESATYTTLKERLTRIRETDSDNIRFIYLVGFRAGQPFFFVDSESADSPDYSPPGQVYSEGSNNFREPFTTNNATPRVDDIYTDRWGTWLTAVTPITDPVTGDVIALLGMDVSATDYYRTLLVYSAFPAMLTFIVVIMLIVGLVLRRREERLLNFKSELVAIASDEIRTPLTSIAWLAENLAKNLSNVPPELKNNLSLIESESHNLLLSLNDFLDLTAIEYSSATKTLANNPVAMLPLFRELEDRFQAARAEKNVQIVIDPSVAPELSVQGDAGRLKNLFSNLISNAIKFSKNDGTVTIAADRKEGRIIFKIIDQGVGIAKIDQERIFSGYYRTKDAKGSEQHGAGLGLRYVQEVADLHGGRTWVESELDKGSTFFVELPA